MALTKEDILEGIGALTVIELKELLDAFEEKFGVTAAAPAAVVVAGGGAAGGAAAEDEKDEFDVILVDGGAQKRCFTDVDEGIEALWRVIANAGGVNPMACAREVRRLAPSLKVAVVLGDDVLEVLEAFDEHSGGTS